MKLFLSLTLSWTLFSTAGALDCQTCTDLLCSNTLPVTCTSETACIAASIQASSGVFSLQQIFKACASPSLCPAIGSQTYSANFGVASALASVQCCNTTNCNSGNPSSPDGQSPNSLQCFTCNSTTSQCTTPLQCVGVEDQCVQANLTSGSSTTPYFGCASANLCAATAGLSNLTFIQSLGNITGGPICCGTNFCNGVAPPATPTTVTTAVTTAATTSEACCVRLAMIHLLFGLFIFTLC